MNNHHIQDITPPIQFPSPQKLLPTQTVARTLLLRYITITTISTSIMMIISGILLYTMFPLQREIPYQTSFIREGNTYINLAPPFEISQQALTAMSKKLARQYIIDRHDIVRSNQVMRERWANPGLIFLQSNKDVYRRFVEGVGQYLSDIRASNATLSVHIDTFSVIQDWSPNTHGFYQIQYTVTGRNANDKIVMEKSYTAQMETTFSPIYMIPYALRYYNPWGFVVVSYAEQSTS